MLKKVCAMSGPVMAAAIVKPASEEIPTPKSNSLNCKPSELPLYAPLKEHLVKKACHEKKRSKAFTTVEGGIRAVRVELMTASNALSSQKQQINNFVSAGRKQTEFVIDYLNKEDNTLPRAGAITVGGLSGYIFGLRGGFFKRSLYATIGAGIIASICYPKEAQMYGQHGLVEANKLITIGYNFVYGIKPGDDANGPNWPKLPTNFSEITDIVSDFANSAKQTVFPDKKN